MMVQGDYEHNGEYDHGHEVKYIILGWWASTGQLLCRHKQASHEENKIEEEKKQQNTNKRKRKYASSGQQLWFLLSLSHTGNCL